MATLQPLVTDNLLTTEECNCLLNQCASMRWQSPSPVGVALSSRLGVVSWLPLDNNAWLLDRISSHLEFANSIFKFDTTGGESSVQLTRYEVNDRLDWHHDCNLNSAKLLRKLTISILLNDTGSLDGGELQFRGASTDSQQQRQGTAIVFPTFLEHRVTPILAGRRVSLVTWALGPAFR